MELRNEYYNLASAPNDTPFPSGYMYICKVYLLATVAIKSKYRNNKLLNQTSKSLITKFKPKISNIMKHILITLLSK